MLVLLNPTLRAAAPGLLLAKVAASRSVGHGAVPCGGALPRPLLPLQLEGAAPCREAAAQNAAAGGAVPLAATCRVADARRAASASSRGSRDAGRTAAALGAAAAANAAAAAVAGSVAELFLRINGGGLSATAASGAGGHSLAAQHPWPSLSSWRTNGGFPQPPLLDTRSSCSLLDACGDIQDSPRQPGSASSTARRAYRHATAAGHLTSSHSRGYGGSASTGSGSSTADTSPDGRQQQHGRLTHDDQHYHQRQQELLPGGGSSNGGSSSGGSSSGIGGGGLHAGGTGLLRSHGPSPGLPVQPAVGSPPPPLQRPDRLAHETVTSAAVAGPGGRHEADAYEGDPREVVLRVLRSATAGACCSPGAGADLWCSDEDEAEAAELLGCSTTTVVAAAASGAAGAGAGLDVEADGIATERAVDSCLAASAATQRQLMRLPGRELAAAALAVLPRLPPWRVAALAVALARMQLLGAEGFKSGLVEHVVGRLYQFSPQQLADVAWALATARQYDVSFLEALAGRLTATAAQWDARSLAQVLWAFGRFSFVLGGSTGAGGGGGGAGGAQSDWAQSPPPPVGAEAVAAMVEKLQGELDGGSVAEVVYAAGVMCGSAGDWQAGRLQRLVGDFAADNMTAFGPEALGKLAAGLTGLGLRDLGGGQRRRLCAAVAGRAAELAARLEPEDLCRVVGLLAANDYCDAEDGGGGASGGSSCSSNSSSSLRALAARAEELVGTTAAAAAAAVAGGRHPHMLLPACELLEPGQAEALAAGFQALGVPLRGLPLVSSPLGPYAGGGGGGGGGGVSCGPAAFR
ncbi:hypothetical protein CHLRE_10g435950v5 [Chlamydomonas reinhardtii]|uniref:RNA-editing substrate-binding complex 6 protein domain-containing protein n=1 Tax=Chlamydomonas reinhardtii TaxID=3055 RepID=A0A2K3DA66_CHLRE|nr:uncharacterized protein CHLRE_10g435950v5 [Chlamydomonas reinhardtii]PNW77424.1 hypothetical protein CHLRE_10g435950v5 [Chlamydomonas reinhardtii]